jgi:phage tail-like protein
MRLAPPPVRYVLARSQESWPEVALAGLAPAPGGELRLLPLPGLAVPWLRGAADLGASGLALDDACGLYVADTSDDRILRIGLDCGSELVLAGAPLQAPRGLAVGAHGWLFVANGGGDVLVYTTPDLRLRDVWPGFQQPIAVVCHGDAVLVVDAGTKRVLRFDVFGAPDAAFDTAMTPPAAPADPRAVAVGADGTIYVGDAAAGGVWRYDWSGASVGPAFAADTQPRALAVHDDVLYVGDATSVEVRLYALPSGDLLGAVNGFDGSVTALVAGDDEVFVKPLLDAAYLTAQDGTAFKASGTLTTGPIDAGEESAWVRAFVSCRRPSGTAVALEWYVDDVSTPGSIAWSTSPSLDRLLPGHRYLWLRITLSTRQSGVSPTLVQLGAQTAGDSYIDFLPYVYTHDPDKPGLTAAELDTVDPTELEPGDLAYLRDEYARTPPEGGFLERLLDLARSQIDDLDRAVAGLPALFDPATAPAALLDWLPSWFAFDVPARYADDSRRAELRQLLLGLAALYRRRGTPQGIADFVEIYTGFRPTLFEEYRARPLWVLDETGLGFGTGLYDRDLDGILVGDSVVGETGPEDPADFGAAVFAATAHRFAAVLPPVSGLDDEMRALVLRVLEAEKPAHTAFHLCFTEPRMRVGLQARVGVDTVLAAEPEGRSLDDDAILGLDTRLAAPMERVGAVGSHAQLGIDTVVG